MRKSFITIATCLSVLGSALCAQNENLQLLIQNNPGLLTQVQGLTGSPGQQSGGTLSNGSQTSNPSAKSPKSPNASDRLQGSNVISGAEDSGHLGNLLLLKPEGQRRNKTSILKRYYSVLSGETLPVYGAAEFSQHQGGELLFFNTIGRDYRLEAGDIVRIILRGFDELDQTIKIARDGNLVIKNLPPLNVSGKTIEQAEEKILTNLKLDDASASAFLYLETARLVTVQVSGNVKAPRTIAVPAYTPVSRIMNYIGGISDTGSLRNIMLRHPDGSVDQIDFYNFLQSPFGSNDPVVVGNSRIFVGNKGPTIGVSGYVARPGIYELAAGVSTLPIKKILELSGTTLIPPGAIVEVLSFDNNGIAQAEVTTLDHHIAQGQALRIRFVETRDLANITVSGAVLDNFEFASTTPVPVRNILKNGSVLTKKALLSFALISGVNGQSKAINLTDALQDKTYKVSPGSTIHIFDQNYFNQLVASDPNKTTDDLFSKISETEIAEIYLNGRRIAFVPPSNTKSFSDVVKPFYRLTPQTHLDFALVQTTTEGSVKSYAISLRQLFQKSDAFKFNAGTKIFIFERAFYSTLLKMHEASDKAINEIVALKVSSARNDIRNNDDDDDDDDDASTKRSEGERISEQKLMFQLSVVGEALSDANVAEVFLDGKAFAFLPSEQPQTLKKMLKILGGLPVSLSTDLVLLSFGDANKKPRATTMASAALTTLQGGVKVNIFTKIGLQKIIKEIEAGRDDTIALQIKSRANTLFIDGQLVAAFGKFTDLTKTSFLDILRMDTTIYPIFSVVSEYNNELGSWEKKVFTLTQLLNQKSDVDDGVRMDLFSTPFLQSVLKNMNSVEMRVDFGQKDTVTPDQLRMEELQKMSPLELQIELQNRQVMAPVQAIGVELQEQLPPLISLKTLEFASRFVGGGVKHPGSYPMAKTVTLADIIATAGGLTPGADTGNVIVQDYQVQDGRLITLKPRRFSSSADNFDKVILSGQFSVDVQTFVNDAFSGSIVLSGEMNRPGEYIFSRSETLHDILARAEGLSDAAYPLGAILERRSAKVQEKAGNVILAEQVQQSVLRLSTSETEGAGDQISAVLGFANQLKEQKPSGRLSVNVLLRDKSVPIFLEDGDRLIIPKRPAHVSIIGSVSQSVKATYSPNKNVADYIAAAGGYSRAADQRRTYMLLPNGEATPLTADTIIPPGSVLIVPPKTDRLSILGLTDLVSRVLGNIATSILAINNVN